MKVLRLLLWAAMVVLAWRMLDGTHAVMPAPVGMLLGVLACLAGIVILGWKGRAANSGGTGGFAKLLRISVWVGLVVMMLYWLGIATRVPVQEVVWAWERTVDPAPVQKSEEENPSGQTTGHMDWNEGSRRALPRQTNIKPAKKPEVFLRIEDRAAAVRMSKQPIYVSSIGYDRYQDSAWHIASEAPGDMRADAAGVIGLDKQAARGSGIWHTIVMSADAKRRSPLVALQGVTMVEGLPGVERWSSCLHLLPQPEKPEKGYRYRAHSRPRMLADVPEDARIGGPYRPVDPAWLRVPEDDLGRRIAELARSVAVGDTPQAKAKALQAHLRGNYRYSLATENPRNLDPLENFLFGEKSGHCEYFASAGALMARAAGLPSRVMYGWAGGTWYEHADWFVFRADEAHVWVELWMGEQGWVVMDPTPPEAIGALGRKTTQDKLPEVSGVTLENSASGEEPESSKPVMGWIASIVLACLAWVVLIRPSLRAGNAVDKKVIREPWRGRAGIHYLDEWRQAAKSRLPRRSLGASTLRQQLRSVHPAPEFAEDLLGYHYRIRYEGQPRDRARERKLTRRIRAWAAEARE